MVFLIYVYFILCISMCYWNSHLQDVVSRTVLVGESNSILVAGPCGCGKSTDLHPASLGSPPAGTRVSR